MLQLANKKLFAESSLSDYGEDKKVHKRHVAPKQRSLG